MEIIFDNENHLSIEPRYIKHRRRHPTMTDVRFITDEIILCASFVGCSLMFYNIKENKHISKTYTYVKGKKAVIDLISICDDYVYVSHIDEKCIGKYMLNHDFTITFIDTISTSKHGRPHGIFVKNNDVFYTTIDVESIILNDTTIYVHPETSQMTSVVLFDEFLIAGGTYTPVTAKGRSAIKIKSFFVIMKKNDNRYDFIKCIDVDNARYDGLSIRDNKIYICDQYNDKVDIYELVKDKDMLNLIKIKHVGGFPMCHGCDFYNGKLAATCYETNSIIVVSN